MAKDAPVDLGTQHQFHGLQPVLPVSDIVETAEHYRDVLGFDIDFYYGDPPDHARVTKGDRTYGDPVYIHFARVTVAQHTPSYLRIHVGKDIDGLFAAYRERGVHVVSQPESQPWGLREFEIRDPNGHVLCFVGYLDDETDTAPPGA